MIVIDILKFPFSLKLSKRPLGSALYDISQKAIYNLHLAAIYEKNTNLISFGVRKDWPELVSIIDKTLAAIPESKKIQIINKWMPPLEKQAVSKPELTEEERAWITERHSVRVYVPTSPLILSQKKMVPLRRLP